LNAVTDKNPNIDLKCGKCGAQADWEVLRASQKIELLVTCRCDGYLQAKVTIDPVIRLTVFEGA